MKQYLLVLGIIWRILLGGSSDMSTALYIYMYQDKREREKFVFH